MEGQLIIVHVEASSSLILGLRSPLTPSIRGPHQPSIRFIINIVVAIWSFNLID